MKKRLEEVDLTQAIELEKDYKKQLKQQQLKLLRFQQLLYQHHIPALFVLEGWDAAGKGGAIKRISQRLDPRGFQVHPISAPSQGEKKYHYLHRFWKKIPAYGQLALFDRSWYGRVLVERVEDFASEAEWKRAYEEINQFEKMLHDDGYIVGKLWFHISKDEQLKRFKEREENPFKRWKITDEDWRNREKWDMYEQAANDMFEQTDTPYAPWTIIEGNDKPFARVKTLKVINEWLEIRLKEKGFLE
ncbi:MAG TPA: UDP-galactose-lipid carrier transferase [Bacillus sp. (in: firmicutes)]|nr:UDP-galactose-lipid carrier transferase [Bacillus sp. (in: firmicutes)]